MLEHHVHWFNFIWQIRDHCLFHLSRLCVWVTGCSEVAHCTSNTSLIINIINIIIIISFCLHLGDLKSWKLLETVPRRLGPTKVKLPQISWFEMVQAHVTAQVLQLNCTSITAWVRGQSLCHKHHHCRRSLPVSCDSTRTPRQQVLPSHPTYSSQAADVRSAAQTQAATFVLISQVFRWKDPGPEL